MLLAHGQVGVHQDPPLQSCFPVVESQEVLVDELLFFPRCSIFPLFKLHKVPLCLFLQSVAVPLSGSMAISSASHSSQCHIICKLAVGALCPIIQVTVWPQYEPLGCITDDGPLAVFMSVMTILWAQLFAAFQLSVHCLFD